ncbi:MAG: hypothetical protein AAF432_11930 [Planctomycetota bacterium]
MPPAEAHPIELKPAQMDYLRDMARKYDLPDEHKAIRCLIDFAMQESAHEKAIFEEIRCLHC